MTNDVSSRQRVLELKMSGRASGAGTDYEAGRQGLEIYTCIKKYKHVSSFVFYSVFLVSYIHMSPL